MEIEGIAMGQPFQNQKKTGFIQKLLLSDAAGNPTGTTSVFAQSLDKFRHGEKGRVKVQVEMPEFFMAAR
jgi:hypothetical protein